MGASNGLNDAGRPGGEQTALNLPGEQLCLGQFAGSIAAIRLLGRALRCRCGEKMVGIEGISAKGRISELELQFLGRSGCRQRDHCQRGQS